MYWIFFFAAFAVCCCIAYQDLTDRAVSWILFPCLALSGLLLSRTSAPSLPALPALLKDTGINILFVAIQLVLVQLYFWLRSRRNPSHKSGFIIDRQIGSGDVLFLLAACCFFPPLNFVLFYILSLLFSLMAYLLFRLRQSGPTIPLAGLQSLFLIAFTAIDQFVFHHVPMLSGEYFRSSLL